MFSPSSTESQIVMSSFLFLSSTDRAGESDSTLNWQLNKHLIAGGHLRPCFRPAHEWRLLWPSSSLILPLGMYGSFSPSGCVCACVCGCQGGKVGDFLDSMCVCACVCWLDSISTFQVPVPKSEQLFEKTALHL